MATKKQIPLNPIMEFYEKNDMSWREIGKETGLLMNQIFRIAAKNSSEDVLRSQLRNIFILEDTLGIDFISYARFLYDCEKKKGTAKKTK